MVQETKWGASAISDARLNEQTIFWGATNPTSGLPANAYYLNTTTGVLAQNTGTEASPIWTSRIKSGGQNTYGDGSDGDVTISSNTDLGSSNIKNYRNLTINAGIILEGNSGMVIRVSETLTFGSGTSQIHCNGKGGAGGTNGGGTGGVGGAGGGDLRVYAVTISGIGIISADGIDGGDATSSSSNTTGGNGGDGTNDGTTVANTGGTGGAATWSVTGMGGAGDGDGGHASRSVSCAQDTDDMLGRTGYTVVKDLFYGLTTGGGGGGGGSDNGNCATMAAGGGAGAGGYVKVICFNTIPAMTIRADGGDGGDGFAAGSTGGGAGGGGSVLVVAGSTDSSTKTAAVGVNGAGNGRSAGSAGTVFTGRL